MSYIIPTIQPDNHSNKIYIDPTAPNGGNGSETNPYNTFNGITHQYDTTYYLRRGTILHERLDERWVNNRVCAYGEGPKPVIYGSVYIKGPSSNYVFYDVEIKAGKIANGRSITSVVDHDRSNGANINGTFAYCRIRGLNEGGYPENVLRHASDNFIMYHNEVSHAWGNVWWLGGNSNVRIVSNWFYKANIEGETSIEGTGDVIQAVYLNNDLYIANNIIDKSNATWKYALMLRKKDAYASERIVVEYNTLIDAKPGRGGAVLYWRPGGDPSTLTFTNTCRKNLLNALEYNGQILRDSSIFQLNDLELQVPTPYGIRDNHILQSGINTLTWPNQNHSLINPDNLVFNTHSAYNNYLINNPSIGQYGSDIDTTNFWNINHKTEKKALNIVIVGGGTINNIPNKTVYDAGETITLQANPQPGYKFSHWSGDLSGVQNPKEIIL
jgi:hypothetical protein